MKKPKVLQRMATWAAREKLTALTISCFVLLVVALVWISDPPTRAQQGGRDELRIELTSNGFTPSDVQHPPGRFAIAIENATLSAEYTLQLKAEDGTVLHEFQVHKGSSAWTVDLQTGTYSLIETAHPQWWCRIAIQ
jgi:hypothetical protein